MVLALESWGKMRSKKMSTLHREQLQLLLLSISNYIYRVSYSLLQLKHWKVPHFETHFTMRFANNIQSNKKDRKSVKSGENLLQVRDLWKVVEEIHYIGNFTCCYYQPSFYREWCPRDEPMIYFLTVRNTRNFLLRVQIGGWTLKAKVECAIGRAKMSDHCLLFPSGHLKTCGSINWCVCGGSTVHILI